MTDLEKDFRELAEALETKTILDMTVRQIAFETGHDLSREFLKAADQIKKLKNLVAYHKRASMRGRVS